MRLYAGKITAISHESVKDLLAAGDIEAESPKEVEADLASVLNQYLATERDDRYHVELLECVQKPGKRPFAGPRPHPFAGTSERSFSSFSGAV